MQPYQTRYIENLRRARTLSDLYAVPITTFDEWYAAQQSHCEQLAAIRRENIELLQAHLFPTLDKLHEASAETIAELEAFADALMDWNTNLDCGIYTLIHESLLSMYRTRRDRNRIIKELYKVGMGLYYRNHGVEAVSSEYIRTFRFENEMVFTEAGSYLKFFADIEDEETRGYIIRALANISICTIDRKRRIAVSARILEIVQDEYYRSLAPGLPWDVFYRRTLQQMSSNRSTLSTGGLTKDELAAVFEACYDVFKPEQDNPNPNVRWLWPYYEMEYTCGFVDLGTTLDRLERLITETPYDAYDTSGLYANVQLAAYYGILLRRNPALLSKPRHVEFLLYAYDKMLKTLLTCPVSKYNDYFYYMTRLAASSYLEVEGGMPYTDILTLLMQRFAGHLYVRSEKAAAMTRVFADAILRDDSTFFNDIDFLAAISDPAEKRRAVLEYAEKCGLYHDLGLTKMDLYRTKQTRNLLEPEYQLTKLHTISAHNDLIERRSTAPYADIAFGHHAFYDGSDGYPNEYVRSRSPYRQMTDLVSLVAYLIDHDTGDTAETARKALAQAHKRFSPIIVSYLNDPQLLQRIDEILRNDKPYFRRLFDRLAASAQPSGKS